MLADIVLVIHFLWVCAIIIPLPLIILGKYRHWSWVKSFWLRVIHLSMMALVALESILGILCPLTVLENWLRLEAGEGSRGHSFIGYWVGKLLFFDLDPLMFTMGYLLTLGLILALWIICPPKRKKGSS